MRLMQRIGRNLIVRNVAVRLAALVIGAAMAVPSWAADGESGPHGAGHMRSGQGAAAAPSFNQTQPAPPPVFNQSSPYTVPQSPETPVSPASPGSVFGNGPSER